MDKAIEVVGVLTLGAIAIVVMAILTALPVMILWNWLMPHLFGLTTIGFWEALGLSALCGCLFKNTSSSSKD